MDDITISEELVFSDATGSFEEVIRQVSAKLQQMHIVKDSYPDAVVAREKEYPTGLDGMYGAFAIPHTYSEHCNHSALSVIRPKEPMRFVRMDDHNDTVDCALIVLLAIDDPKKQLPMLRKLMKAMQDEETFRILSQEKCAHVVAETLKTVCACE